MSGTAGLTRALKHRAFLLLFVAQSVSLLGSSMHRVALAWWVMSTTSSGFAMGTVMICSIVPAVPFLFIGGAVVDRFDRVRIMLVANIVRGFLAALIAVLMAIDQLQVWHLYFTAAAFGTFDGFFIPAVRSVIATAVPKEDRTSANSLRAMSSQLAMVGGPMVAAAVIAVGESELAFAIDAASYFFAALAVWPLLRLELSPKRKDVDQTTILGDIRDGIAFMRRERWLWISILIFFVINAAELPIYSIGVPFVVTQMQKQSATVFGIIQALAAGASIIASIWIGRRQKIPLRGWVIYGSVIGAGIVGAAMALPLSIYGIAGLVMLGSFANAVMVLAWVSVMQDRVPAEQFGRVSALDQASAIITMPIGLAVFGWAIDRMEPTYMFALAGGITVVFGIVALLFRDIRELD